MRHSKIKIEEFVWLFIAVNSKNKIKVLCSFLLSFCSFVINTQDI